MTISPLTLVTGGGGLIGKAIQEEVQKSFKDEKFVFLSSKDGDLRDWEATKKIFEKYNPSSVVHLAARVGGLFANQADNLGFFNDNIKINMNVIECCHRWKVEKAVFCLSTCVFPSEAPLPLTEDILHSGPPHPSNEGYAFAKRALECQVRYYRESHGYPWQCVIPTNVYGPHDNFHLEHSHVIPALIRKCVHAKETGTDFVVSGTGTPLRQFIYSKDLARLFLALLHSQCPSSPPSEGPKKDREAKWGEGSFICCGDVENPDSELSILEVAQKIREAVGGGEIKLDSSKSDGIFRKTASNKKLREKIGKDFVFTSFDVGIKETVDWFLAQDEGKVRL